MFSESILWDISRYYINIMCQGKASSPAAKRLVKAGVADIAGCCGLGERARRPSRTSRSAILKEWHEHVTKSGSFKASRCFKLGSSSSILCIGISHNFTIQVTQSHRTTSAPLVLPSFSLSAAKRVWMVIGSWGSSSRSSGSLEALPSTMRSPGCRIWVALLTPSDMLNESLNKQTPNWRSSLERKRNGMVDNEHMQYTHIWYHSIIKKGQSSLPPGSNILEISMLHIAKSSFLAAYCLSPRSFLIYPRIILIKGWIMTIVIHHVISKEVLTFLLIIWERIPHDVLRHILLRKRLEAMYQAPFSVNHLIVQHNTSLSDTYIYI